MNLVKRWVGPEKKYVFVYTKYICVPSYQHLCSLSQQNASSFWDFCRICTLLSFCSNGYLCLCCSTWKPMSSKLYWFWKATSFTVIHMKMVILMFVKMFCFSEFLKYSSQFGFVNLYYVLLLILCLLYFKCDILDLPMSTLQHSS
jgi:hypothetical protein